VVTTQLFRCPSVQQNKREGAPEGAQGAHTYLYKPELKFDVPIETLSAPKPVHAEEVYTAHW